MGSYHQQSTHRYDLENKRTATASPNYHPYKQNQLLVSPNHHQLNQAENDLKDNEAEESTCDSKSGQFYHPQYARLNCFPLMAEKHKSLSTS